MKAAWRLMKCYSVMSLFTSLAVLDLLHEAGNLP